MTSLRLGFCTDGPEGDLESIPLRDHLTISGVEALRSGRKRMGSPRLQPSRRPYHCRQLRHLHVIIQQLLVILAGQAVNVSVRL